MTRLIEHLETRRLFAYALANALDLGGGAGDDVTVADVANDREGYLFVAGRFEGTCDFDVRRNHAFVLESASALTGSPRYGGDAFLAKYTADGRLVWARQLSVVGDGAPDSLGGAVGGLAVDESGAVHLSGTFDGTVDFNPLRGKFPLTGGESDGFVWKLDADGRLAWAKAIPNLRLSPAGTAANAVTVDASGDVVVTGEMQSLGDEGLGAGFVARLAGATGEIAYDKLLPLDLDVVSGRSLAADAEGHVYVAGRRSSVDDNQGTFAAKITRKGGVVWSTPLGGTFAGDTNGIAVSRRGTVFVAGTTSGQGTFGDTSDTSAGPSDAFLARLDGAVGTVAWARTWGGDDADGADDVVLDDNEQLVVGGRFLGRVDFNPGKGTATLDAGASEDFYVARFDQQGSFAQVSRLGGKGGRTTQFGKVTASRRGDVFAGGSFSGVFDLDPGPGTSVVDTGGGVHGFVVRLRDE